MKRQPVRILAEGIKLIIGLIAAVLLMHFSGIGCPIRWLSGIPCAGCGMSRAALALAHGHVQEAVRLHPLVLLLPPGALLCAAYALMPERFPKKAVNIALWGTAALFVIVYTVRILHHDPVLYINLSEGMLWKLTREVKNVLSKLW